ncbi:hypothetical protein CRV24_001627 [Beauveria bassiana]|nr:hypothetical protein CRV24_001627 [Beauveria bassiana]
MPDMVMPAGTSPVTGFRAARSPRPLSSAETEQQCQRILPIFSLLYIEHDIITCGIESVSSSFSRRPWLESAGDHPSHCISALGNAEKYCFSCLRGSKHRLASI